MAGRRTQIHNLSNQPISLIPFSRQNNENLQSIFTVRRDLAQTITVGNPITVECGNYDLSAINNHSQIYILFRAGNYDERVQRAAGEQLFTHAELSTRRNWYLRLNERGQVTPVDNAGQMPQIAEPNAAGAQNEPELQFLREAVERLTGEINALQNRMAALEERLSK